jgi:hypothetical protein
LDLFWDRRKKLRLQPARAQHFAHGSKTHALCDRAGFQERAIFGHLPCNIMMVNVFGVKMVPGKSSQICVNYITGSSRKAEKARFLLTRISSSRLP